MAEFQLTFQSIFSVVGVYTHYSYLLHHANAKRPHGTSISCALMTQKAESWAYESDPQLTFFPKGHIPQPTSHSCLQSSMSRQVYMAECVVGWNVNQRFVCVLSWGFHETLTLNLP